MNKRYLYTIAGLIWGLPGLMITWKGLTAYTLMTQPKIYWLCVITLCVLVGFIWMFRRIVDRYCGLIDALPEQTTLWHTFPLRGWILVVGMSCLGMVLKFLPFIPMEFTASFYSGLGPALVLAAIRFIRRSF